MSKIARSASKRIRRRKSYSLLVSVQNDIGVIALGHLDVID